MAKRWYYKDENGNKVPVPQYKIDADDYYTKTMSDSRYYDKSATDTLLGDKVSKTDITQSTGTSTTSVMSQKAVSDALSTKVAKTDIVQSAGNATDKIMSQKASTDSFIANTPSGDPMHNMYVAIGAEWNGSGVDKTYPTPWADYAEDEEDKVYVHKSGHWAYCYVGDLTSKDMADIAILPKIYHAFPPFFATNFQGRAYASNISSAAAGNLRNYQHEYTSGLETFFTAGNIEVIVLHNSPFDMDYVFKDSIYTFAYTNLRCIFGAMQLEGNDNNVFTGCKSLKFVFLYKLGINVSFKDCPKLSKHCVRYMIENATDATITITLHPEAYERAIADAGVQTALANKTNVSLAKEAQYLTLSALEDGEITITISSDLGPAYATYLSYSKDKSVWERTDINGKNKTIRIPVSRGDNVYLKGKAKQWYNQSDPGGAEINSSANINVSGNIMSLLYEDNFEDKTVFPDNSSHVFSLLFYNNKHLCSAEKLILPATTLANSCYRLMFYGCSSLTVAPTLPAPKLTNYCYWSMFNGCASLNSITMLATDISVWDCLEEWVSGVAATGTFTKATSMTSLPSGASGIPTGWTVENV